MSGWQGPDRQARYADFSTPFSILVVSCILDDLLFGSLVDTSNVDFSIVGSALVGHYTLSCQLFDSMGSVFYTQFLMWSSHPGPPRRPSGLDLSNVVPRGKKPPRCMPLDTLLNGHRDSLPSFRGASLTLPGYTC